VQFISQELISELMSRPWPGNVRELENLIERGVIVCQGDTLRPEDLGGLSGAEGRQAAENPGCMPDPLSGGGSYQEARALLMEQLERKYLETSLLSTGGSISGTSRLMGLSPRCIYEKMRKYGLDKSKFKTYGH
jgi:DNA-binding NtrC family response regulator